jgi:hypothetical protein
MSAQRKYEIEPLTTDELSFFKQLFASDLAVTIKTVEVVASLKRKIANAKPIAEPPE